jgi:hypothetical protein
VLGELVQTTAGKWITHTPSRCPNGHALGLAEGPALSAIREHHTIHITDLPNGRGRCPRAVVARLTGRDSPRHMAMKGRVTTEAGPRFASSPPNAAPSRLPTSRLPTAEGTW